MTGQISSVRGVGQRTSGATDATMHIWYVVDQAGEPGLTKDQIIEKAGPRIDKGYARRSYALKLNRDRRNIARVNPATLAIVHPGDVDDRKALGFLINRLLKDGIKSRWLTKDDEGFYHAMRKPRHRDEASLTFGNDPRAAIHMEVAELLRIVKAYEARAADRSQPRLSSKETDRIIKGIRRLGELTRGRSTPDA